MLRRSRSVRYSLPFFIYLLFIYLFIENEKGRKGRSDPPCQKEGELVLPPLGSSWDLKGVGMGKERQVRDECVTTVVRP